MCMRAGTPPQTNSTALVRKLLAAHGVVMGKTRMHELAYGVTSINPVFGPVLNPYDPTKIPGGALHVLLHSAPHLSTLLSMSCALCRGTHFDT